MNIDTVPTAPTFDITYPVVIVGAGACGLSAALAASDAGLDVLVLERDKSPLGTTAMSTGLIPAAGTPEQQALAIDDSAALFADDIQRKSGYGANALVVDKLAAESAETVAWLRDSHRVPLTLVTGFTYPGHSAKRMYGAPHRSGGELIAALQTAASAAAVDLLTEALVEDLIVDIDKQILGVRVIRPDGAIEELGCGALILACCGFAGNQQMVADYIPEMANAVFHGHPGNKGHAVRWGKQLGAGLADMGAYQGHGGLAHGYGIPILWPLIMQGGFQVNRDGRRFSDESNGYSEQAVEVLRQPGGIAWSIFDQRLYQLMLDFEDFNDAVSAGAIVRADNLESLAQQLKLPFAALNDTVAEVRACARGSAVDSYRRDFTDTLVLQPPYYAARVTGALFHTQGGLEVDDNARVLLANGEPLPNLYAGGGAARGISGSGGAGYIAGNGLLTATGLGKIAGRHAARRLTAARSPG